MTPLPASCSTLDLPEIVGSIPAGFPSPAADHEEERIDLATLLVRQPAATSPMRVSGDSMIKYRIYDGDVVLVDWSLRPADGKIVVASIDGEVTLKRFSRRAGRIWLETGNHNYPPIEVREDAELVIFGVVTSATTMFGW
ncbi:MAG: LexA family protein [Ferrovibrio sp.]|uniref:LexA family protein n=1 Tax=Ferrovibrio sp. TaxID=1917215 RepID=UPI00391CE10E